jgi:hypothetical protein
MIDIYGNGIIKFPHDFNIYEMKKAKSLIFNNNFNQPIDNIPNSIIKKISLGKSFNQPIDNLQISFIQKKNKFINKSNKHWLINYCYLPNSLTHLTLEQENFNQTIDNLPRNLTHLELVGTFNQSIDNLPNSITHLTLGPHFNKDINRLPLKLKSIILEYFSNVPFSDLMVKINKLHEVIPINCHIDTKIINIFKMSSGLGGVVYTCY